MTDLVRTLMDEFAAATGLVGTNAPRRYLWTDAFAVCNFLGLFRETGDERYLKLARALVDQVHHILGRHREDDSRRGWISGLPEEEGVLHPTRGGLRIGKSTNERGPGQPLDSELEWDRDGQYFHYLTKWMHALCRMTTETGEFCYLHWATELAIAAHRSFTREARPGGPKWIVWKMSIDLSRPLVPSTGQHDSLDGLVVCLELQACKGIAAHERDRLDSIVNEMVEMTSRASLATDDPLGIGGLLDDATRLAQLNSAGVVECHELLYQILVAANVSLESFVRMGLLKRSPSQRLPFRELGLAIGIRGLDWVTRLVAPDNEMAAVSNHLLRFQPLAEQIQNCWSDSTNRLCRTWTEHRDINAVMLASSLSPDGYLQLDSSTNGPILNRANG